MEEISQNRSMKMISSFETLQLGRVSSLNVSEPSSIGTFLHHVHCHEWSKNVPTDYSALLNLKIMDNITRGMISAFSPQSAWLSWCCVVLNFSLSSSTNFHPLSLTWHRVCCYVRHLTWFPSLAFDISPILLFTFLNFNLSSFKLFRLVNFPILLC